MNSVFDVLVDPLAVKGEVERIQRKIIALQRARDVQVEAISKDHNQVRLMVIDYINTEIRKEQEKIDGITVGDYINPLIGKYYEQNKKETD